jgi:hypothetical protein
VRVDVDLLVPPLQRLEIGARVVAFPSPTPLHLAAGYLELQEPIVLTVCSNVPWELRVRSADPPLRMLVDGHGEAPRVECRVGERPFVRLTTEWVPVAGSDHAADEMELELMLRIPVTWTTTTPGSYQPRIEYVLAPAGG